MANQSKCSDVFHMDFGLDHLSLKKEKTISRFWLSRVKEVLQQDLFVVSVFSHLFPLPLTISSFLCGKWDDAEKAG